MEQHHSIEYKYIIDLFYICVLYQPTAVVKKMSSKQVKCTKECEKEETDICENAPTNKHIPWCESQNM